jgi:hypothetical protein
MALALPGRSDTVVPMIVNQTFAERELGLIELVGYRFETDSSAFNVQAAP